MIKRPQVQRYWIMRHFTGHVYPDTLRILRKDCCRAFAGFYKPHDGIVHRPIKVTLHAADQFRADKRKL